MTELSLADKRHLEAAQGWIGLGDHVEADVELENIAPRLRGHPDVLEVRWHIYAHAKKWDACADIAAAIITLDPDRPDAWIHRSFALHELKRTQEAFDQLLPVADRFPKLWTIPYNLACYCAQLLRLDECQGWFKKGTATWSQSSAPWLPSAPGSG
jgi:predicted Zn-dependent protease